MRKIFSFLSKLFCFVYNYIKVTMDDTNQDLMLRTLPAAKAVEQQTKTPDPARSGHFNGCSQS